MAAKKPSTYPELPRVDDNIVTAISFCEKQRDIPESKNQEQEQEFTRDSWSGLLYSPCVFWRKRRRTKKQKQKQEETLVTCQEKKVSKSGPVKSGSKK